MLEGISLWTFLTLVNCGEINSLLRSALFCCREWIARGDVRLKAVDERKIYGHILKDRDSACFNEISDAFCSAVLACEAPLVSVAGFLCISIRYQRHIHDLANLLECRIELVHDEVSASSAQSLIVECYSDLRSCCRCRDSKQRKSDQQDGE